jgi:O-antigen ligase
MPLYLVRFSVFGIPSTLLEAMIYVLFLVWVLGETKKENRFGRMTSLVQNEQRLSYGIVLLFSGLLISAAFSDDLRTSLGIVKGWFFDPLLVFLIFVSCIRNEKDIKKVLLSWTLSGFTVAVAGIGYYLAGNLTFDGRVKAFYLSPNHLAMYLAPSLLIAIWFFLKKESSFSKDIEKGAKLLIGSLAPLAIIVISISLYLTHSFGSLLGISASLFCMFGKRFFAEVRAKKRSGYVLVFLAILSFGVFLVYGKMVQIENSGGRSSFHSRLMIWEASWEMIKESPVVGIGPGTFQEKYLSIKSRFKDPYLEWAVSQPHNIFLDFYLQTGLVGFAGFLLLLSWFFGKDNRSDISKLLMVYVLIHGLIDTTYWKNDLAVMFWLVLGIACSMKPGFEEKGQSKHIRGAF